MPELDAIHDFAHPVEGDSAWSESYYFNGYDPAADTGLFTRIGVRPNEGRMDVGWSIWLPGDRIAHVHDVRPQHEMTDSDLTVAGVRYERIEPMRRWRLTARSTAKLYLLPGTSLGTAPVEADLTFESITPPIGSDGQAVTHQTSAASSSAAATVGKGHFEQAGRWSGTVQVGDEQFSFDPTIARGNRDKSWGPRSWSGPQMWRWFSINVGDDVHFGGIRLGTVNGDLHRGWVWRNGRAISVARWEITTTLADDGLTQRSLDLRVTDKEGHTHDLHGEVLRIAPLPNRQGERITLVNEGLTRWTYEGRVGYGIAEYLHQLTLGGVPLVTIE